MYWLESSTNKDAIKKAISTAKDWNVFYPCEHVHDDESRAYIVKSHVDEDGPAEVYVLCPDCEMSDLNDRIRKCSDCRMEKPRDELNLWVYNNYTGFLVAEPLYVCDRCLNGEYHRRRIELEKVGGDGC